jgi:hypothetical protein
MTTTPFILTKNNSMKTLVKAVLTFSLLIFLLNGLNAITYEWKGTIDNNWNNPGNWLRGNGTPVPGPPTAGDDIMIDGTFRVWYDDECYPSK